MVTTIDLNSGGPFTFNVPEGTEPWTKVAQFEFVPRQSQEDPSQNQPDVLFLAVWPIGGNTDNIFIDPNTNEVFVIGSPVDSASTKQIWLECACFVQFADGTSQNEASIALTANVVDRDNQPNAMDFTVAEGVTEKSDNQFSIREDIASKDPIKLVRLDISDVDEKNEFRQYDIKIEGADKEHFLPPVNENGEWWLYLKGGRNLDQDVANPKSSYNIRIEYSSVLTADTFGDAPDPEPFELVVQKVDEPAELAPTSPTEFYVDEDALLGFTGAKYEVGRINAIDPDNHNLAEADKDKVSLFATSRLVNLLQVNNISFAELDNQFFFTEYLDSENPQNGMAKLMFSVRPNHSFDYESKDEYKVFVAVGSTANRNPAKPNEGTFGFHTGQLITVKVNNVIEEGETMTVQVAADEQSKIGKVKFGADNATYSVYERDLTTNELKLSSNFVVYDGHLVSTKDAVARLNPYNLVITENGTDNKREANITLHNLDFDETDGSFDLEDGMYANSENAYINVSLGRDEAGNRLGFVAGQSGETENGTWEVYETSYGSTYLRYTAKEDADGQTDSFSIGITDGNGGFGVVTITLKIGLEKTATEETPNIDGGGFDDVLTGDEFVNHIFGNDGDDILKGKGGNDTLYGGNGHDLLYGDEGRDGLNGGAGNDTMWGGAEVDIIDGGLGSDQLYGDEGDDVLKGGADSDSLYGGTGKDEIDGGSGDDHINGEAGADEITCGTGDDFIIVRKGQHGDIIKDFNDAEGDTLCIPGYGDDPIYVHWENGNTYLKDGTGDDAITYVTLENFTNIFTKSSLVEYNLADLVYVDLPEPPQPEVL